MTPEEVSCLLPGQPMSFSSSGYGRELARLYGEPVTFIDYQMTPRGYRTHTPGHPGMPVVRVMTRRGEKVFSTIWFM